MSFRKIVSGTATMSAARVFRLAGQFVVVPILARLLSPADYGLVAMAMPFALFAMMLADAGIGISLVRAPLSKHKEWSACFWLSIALGLALATMIAGLAPLASHLLHEPALTGLILALALTVILQSIHVIPAAALQQASRFQAIATADTVGTIMGMITAVVMAYQHYGAWALVGQQLAFFTVRVCISVWLTPFRPTFYGGWSTAREHVLFGRNVLGNSVLTYFARSFDNWVVGKVLGAALLGFYSMAFLFARLPVMLVSGPLQYVLYSRLVTIKDDPKAIGRVYILMVRLLAILLIPAMGMVAVAHAPIFTFLLSAKWAQASVLFMLAAPATTLQSIAAVGETSVYAMGRTDVQLRATAEFCVVWVIALLVAVHVGLEQAVIAYTFCVFLYHPRYLALILPLMHVKLRDYLAAFIFPLIGTGVASVLYLLCNAQVTLLPWQQIAFAAALAFTVMALNVTLQRERLRKAIRALAFN